ncbi:MAG: hypothetical protein WC612_02430, partial [Bdellovibrionales bacterium]
LRSLEKQGQNTSRIEEGSAEKNDQLFALKIVNLPTPFDHYAEIAALTGLAFDPLAPEPPKEPSKNYMAFPFLLPPKEKNQ